MLRLIDDYLFVTTDLEKARKFLEVMKTGHPDYGCFISQDKTLTNFDASTNILPADQPSILVVYSSVATKLMPVLEFPWCGLFIDTLDLSVTTDYTRFHET
jgi:telomerase reverse transcriptase